jgi:CBS domain-containing protein
MQKIRERLNDIAQQLKKGVTPPRVTVREILGWLDVSRRGSNVNWRVRSALEKAGLTTQPDFEWAYIDGAIKFIAIGSNEEQGVISTTYQIDGLESANRKPVSVKPDRPLTEATTIMLTNDFSQLPVMTTGREVKGSISWKSIGIRLALGKKCTVIRECMDPAQIIAAESSLFEAIKIITEHDYVLVQAQDRTICGIVTASDLSQQFSNLAEPFLLIGECENLIRRLIHGKFKVEELKEAQNSSDPNRTVAGVADLTLGEYVRLLEDASRWSRLKLSVDRREFIDRLDKVREIRNDIMHFDPQGVDPEAMKVLREFVRFLQELRRLGAM